MDEDLKQNLTARETWLRGLFILLFAFFLVIARIVTGAVVVIQFLFTVFTGKTNDNLKNFGASLSRYVYQCLLFVTYNADDKPFPFDEWPEAKLLTVERTEEKAGTTTVKAKAAPKAAPKKKASPKKKSTAKKTVKTKSEAKPETKPEAKPEAEVASEADAGTAPETPSNKPETKPES